MDLHLGQRVQFADGSIGRITALRRAFVDGDVVDQLTAGPDEGIQTVPDDVGAYWIGTDAITPLVPIDADAAIVAAEQREADAKIALLRQQISDRLDLIGDTTDPIDVGLRALIVAIEAVADLPVSPALADAFVRAAHALIRAVVP